MTNYSRGIEYLRKIAEAIGVADLPVQSIRIDAGCRGPAVATVAILIGEDEGKKLLDVLKLESWSRESDPCVS